MIFKDYLEYNRNIIKNWIKEVQLKRKFLSTENNPLVLRDTIKFLQEKISESEEIFGNFREFYRNYTNNLYEFDNDLKVTGIFVNHSNYNRIIPLGKISMEDIFPELNEFIEETISVMVDLKKFPPIFYEKKKEYIKLSYIHLLSVMNETIELINSQTTITLATIYLSVQQIIEADLFLEEIEDIDSSYLFDTDDYTRKLIELGIDIEEKLDFESDYDEEDEEEDDKLRNDYLEKKESFEPIIRKYIKAVVESSIVLSVLKQMNPEFPVFLPRLAELTELDKSSVEKALKLILQKTPDIGRYDPMAQVLMFNKPEEVLQLLNSIIDKGDPTKYKCMICNRDIHTNEPTSACPHCENTAHSSELLEWLKNKSICPVCKHSLKESDIILVNKKK